MLDRAQRDEDCGRQALIRDVRDSAADDAGRHAQLEKADWRERIAGRRQQHVRANVRQSGQHVRRTQHER